VKIPPDPSPLKAALRVRFAAERLAMTQEEYRAASEAACVRIGSLSELGRATTISVYWPLLNRRELDTRPLIRFLIDEGKRIALPVVAGTAPPRMKHVAFDGEDQLRPNQWGILEPEGPEIAAADLDVVIVPALGAGRNGHRIGYGHGFYDVFLREAPGVAIAAVFARCIVDHVPAEPHDIPLQAVVTEAETIRPSPADARNNE